MRAARITILVAAFAACPDSRPAPDPTGEAGHAGEAGGHAHAEDPPHPELPRSVSPSPEVVAAAGITTAPVTRARLPDVVSLQGEIVADPDLTARVSSRLAGSIARIAVHVGDLVRAGDVLATVRAPNLAELRSAQASLRARATSARANADRLAGLASKRLAADQEARAAAAEATALEAEARAASQHLEAIGPARTRGRDYELPIRSPIDGVVTDLAVVLGDPVRPDQVVASVVDLSRVWFSAHVFENDLARVKVGSPAEIVTTAWPDDRFEGTVEHVGHAVQPGTRTLAARIPLVNREGRLRIGLWGAASVAVEDPNRAPTLVVPRGAVARIADRTIVFVRQADGHFDLHDVVIGRGAPGRVEVLQGLREGETIAVEGVFNLESLVRVPDGGDEGH
jgi:cobalt-zinc-cadmium efflux system membrane fusion protein